MKKLFCLLAVFCFFSVSIFAQDLRRKAEESPLDCAKYLEVNSKELSRYFWRAGRNLDALQVLNSVENGQENSQLLYEYADDLLKKKDKKLADKLLLQIIKIDKDEIEFRLYPKIVEDLILIGREKEAFEFVQSLESEEYKVYSLLGIAKAFVKNGHKEKMLEKVSQALDLANKNEDNFEDRNPYGEVAEIYLSIGETEKASEILKKVDFSNISKWDWFNFLQGIYIESGNTEKAIKFIEESEIFEPDSKLLKKAQIYASAGNKEKAITFLQQIPNNDETRYIQDDVVNFYLELGEDVLALERAKAIGYDYSQQKSLLAVADFYISQKRIDTAIYTLNLAFEQSQKIASDHQELQMDSTSPQMEKAKYMSAIADKFLSINRLDLALEVVNKIEKPFRKVSKLADIAEKQNTKTAFRTLNQSLSIITKSEEGFLDEGKYAVWAKAGEKFAKIGAKSKALEVFAELLNDYQNNETETSYLMEIGYHFEKSELKADEKIKTALREIIKREKDED